MSRQIVEQSATTVSATVPYWTFAGTWTQGVADSNASSGTYASSSTAGATATLTIPAGASPVVDGVGLLCSRTARTGIATVNVDGVAQPDNWIQDDFTTAAATAGQTFTVATKPQPIAWQRTLYRPIRLSTGVAHTIVVAVVAGPVTVDAAECYTSAAITAGRVTTLGHSIPAGFGLATPSVQRFPALAATAIGGTDDNHAYASSALCYDTNATGLTPPPVGWLQAEGATGTVGGTDAYTNGVHWWGRTPEYALMMHGLNDANTYGTLDPGGGAGYIIELFKQRAREVIWRMNLNSPNTLVVMLGVAYVTDAVAANQTLRRSFGTALAAVCGEASMSNTTYMETWNAITNNGKDQALQVDGIHPNATVGHPLLARDLIAALQRGRARPSNRAGY